MCHLVKRIALGIEYTQSVKINAYACVPSSIQTILSVSEFHRIGAYTLADFTAGGESHPALKILFSSPTA